MKGDVEAHEYKIPGCIRQMLVEFPDVISQNQGLLPPSREVDHRIDLVPKAALPNLPHYRLSPKETDFAETEILQSQVEQLLKDSLIQPSISPCAVPTLLVPKKNGQ